MQRKKRGNSGLAISQIILLIVSIVAISYAIGGGVGLVSAQTGPCILKKTNEADPGTAIPPPNIDINDEKAVNNWCYNNGRSDVCTGGSPNYKLRITTCLSQQQTGQQGRVPISGIQTMVGQVAFEEAWQIGAREIAARRASEEMVEDATRKAVEDTTRKAVEETTKKVGEGLLSRGSGSAIAKIKAGIASSKTIILGAGIGTFVIVFAVSLMQGHSAERSAKIAGRKTIGVVGGAAIGAAVAGPIGAVAGGIIGFFLSDLLKRERMRKIEFTCKPWQAPKKGAGCDSCNDGLFPCAEYQCKSLGTGCELINKNSDDPRCVWFNERDVAPPDIIAWTDVLTEGYRYDPLPRGQYGVEVKYQNEECLPYSQPFNIGVELDKLGYCKIDYQRIDNFADMVSDFGDSNLYTEKHIQPLTFPGVVHLQQEGALNLTSLDVGLYVRCESASNNVWNRDEFLFKFCIDGEPDTSAPEIKGFNLEDGTPIAYFDENEIREVDVQVYTNELSQCKWGHEDKSYENMENQLVCPNSIANINSQLSYTCSGKLTGLENNKENKFFFRCNDTFGNLNVQSKTLTLIGTRPLHISEVKPNETIIRGSTDSIKITLEATTSAGYKEGESICSYSNTGLSGTYIKFSDTNSHQHSTNVWLGPGNYNYFVRCIDLAGNSDTKEIGFTVETDTQAPVVVRAFHKTTFLKLITNEKAECVYSPDDCSYLFEDGIAMSVVGDTGHTTNWDPDTSFYIKCQDEFENRPFPDQCSITVRPFEV